VADPNRPPGPAAPQKGEPPGRPCLLLLSGAQFGELVELTPGVELPLGRRTDAGLFLADDGVSRRHAVLVVRSGEALLRDLESQNGTWVDGERVAEVKLADGQTFSLGAHTRLRFLSGAHPEAALQRSLAQGALREPLTGLYNRRHFLERLTSELAASQRHGRALSLLLLDLDHMKRVNEAHGAAGGDEVLRGVARVVQGTVRKEDVVARVGGEELAVLARDTGLSGARVLGERIRKAVHKARAVHQGREIAVTVSVGVTVSQGLTAFEPGRTEQQLWEAAERSLSRAKQLGRNTVVAAPAAGG
jgi:diguanylate cyclase (GGDEF)-like protein